MDNNVVSIVKSVLFSTPPNQYICIIVPTYTEERYYYNMIRDTRVRIISGNPFKLYGVSWYHILIVDGDRMYNLEEVLDITKDKSQNITLIWSETRDEINARIKAEQYVE